MFSMLSTFIFLAATSAFASSNFLPLPQHALYPRAQTILWGPCPDFNQTGTLPIECGSLAVPLDYTDPSNAAVIDLELRRVAATKGPSIGSILVNYGGPGYNGRDTLAMFGSWQMTLSGGIYDIVLVVPRGTGNTLRFSCYPNNDQRLAAYARNPISSNASDTALGRIWAVSQLDADTCFMAQNETGSFIGTGFTARDFMQVVDALDADGLLRFWGQSYGTILGATLAAMYPDRIERMILDGVVDPIEYTHGSDYPQYTDTDAVFSTFCTACAANPTTCPLSQSPTNTTLSPPEIANTLTTLLTTTKQVPIPLQLSTGPYLLDAATLKSLLYVILYSPSAWPYYSTLFAALLSPDPASLAPFLPVLSALVSTSLGLDDEAVYGIRCSDKTFRAEGIEDVVPGLEQRQGASYFGDNDANFVGCARWRFEARGRYGGDFKAKMRKGVLVVGNTGDPATPLGNARVEGARLAGSRVLEHGGFGHSIFAQAGRCTARVVREYWVEGTLPREGTKCEVDVGLWEGKTGWEEVVAEMDAEGSGAV